MNCPERSGTVPPKPMDLQFTVEDEAYRQRVREWELERLTGKVVSTRKAEDDDYYFDTEQRLRSWAKRVRR